MTKKQKHTFIQSEGDNWYQRNLKSIDAIDMKNDPVVNTLEQLDIKNKSILEIGCAHGYRLDYLHRNFGVKACGIDPSSKAIEEGLIQYSNLNLKVGTADHLEFEADSFDIVIYGFCLYLCDRDELFRIAAEADRVLKSGGYLIIFDFVSSVPYHNQYVHLEGLKSYKMDYATMFTWNPMYSLVRRNILPTPETQRIGGLDDRIGVDVIHKEHTAYPPNPFK